MKTRLIATLSKKEMAKKIYSTLYELLEEEGLNTCRTLCRQGAHQCSAVFVPWRCMEMGAYTDATQVGFGSIRSTLCKEKGCVMRGADGTAPFFALHSIPDCSRLEMP